MSRIEVVGMVYRSDDFASFIRPHVDRIVANDPLHSLSVYDAIYHDPHLEDYYLARVYRCWNWCVESSQSEYVCLVNSDMAFSPGWLDALERRLDGKTLPCSRLVEPGFIKPGQHAIEIDLGRDPRSFPMGSWHSLASDLSVSEDHPGGLFMPCVLQRDAFLRVGGYPPGNLNLPLGEFGAKTHPKSHVMYRNGKPASQVVSGDADLFWRMEQEGFQHVTCFDSLVYHMQEGEMRHVE